MSSEPQAQMFALKVLAAFKDAGLYTDDEIKAAGGPSSTTMGNIRKAAAGLPMRDGRLMGEPRSDVHAGIDTAARWPRGSSRLLWHKGQEPLASEEGRTLALVVRRSNIEEPYRSQLLDIVEAHRISRVREAAAAVMGEVLRDQDPDHKREA